MLINSSLHNLLENLIFDFKIDIDTKHPVQTLKKFTFYDI